jgi:multicomponent Na+:H+ antiporter subunit F
VNVLFIALAFILLLALLGGIWRVVAGPTAADRLLAVHVLGTLGIGILLLLARIVREPAIADAGLLMAILSLVATMAFARRLAPPVKEDEGGG